MTVAIASAKYNIQNTDDDYLAVVDSSIDTQSEAYAWQITAGSSDKYNYIQDPTSTNWLHDTGSGYDLVTSDKKDANCEWENLSASPAKQITNKATGNHLEIPYTSRNAKWTCQSTS